MNIEFYRFAFRTILSSKMRSISTLSRTALITVHVAQEKHTDGQLDRGASIRWKICQDCSKDNHPSKRT